MTLRQKDVSPHAIGEPRANRHQHTDVSAANVLEKLKVDDLQPHPRQNKNFPRKSPEKIEALAADIRENGLQHAIEVRSDRKTIIAGHRRVEAVKKLGWEKIPAVIREDLEANGELAIEAYLIGDNFTRRHCTPLEQARCAKRLIEIEIEQSGDGHKRRLGAREMQKRVGERLGIGDRQVRRLLRVLRAPEEVQDAYEAGKLHIDLAGRAANLDEETQMMIAEEMSKGDDPTEVLSWYVDDRKVEQRGGTWMFRQFLNGVKRAVESLGNRVPEIRPNINYVDSQVLTLQKGSRLIEEIVDHLSQLKETNCHDSQGDSCAD